MKPNPLLKRLKLITNRYVNVAISHSRRGGGDPSDYDNIEDWFKEEKARIHREFELISTDAGQVIVRVIRNNEEPMIARSVTRVFQIKPTLGK